ncbi:hypothetical protein DSO57_1035729 [Entomophthora muscae]|uniref:Uncharacterized protein n=1 Tax=Entomophthora muscae TaxID=34485 RepID=A0ACC2SZV0_9FUNG|nr:hypothetical protein DSO57_1035729 [Entomophthora muscae]
MPSFIAINFHIYPNMKLLSVTPLMVSATISICLTHKQCLSSALDELKDSYQYSGCAVVQNENVEPRGEWSVNTVKRGMFEFKVYCANRQDCSGCSIELDDDNFFSVHGYDTTAFKRRGNTLFLLPSPK